jgi:hypothetical protein
MAVRWMCAELLSASRGSRGINLDQAIAEDLLWLPVLIGACVIAVRWSLRNGLPRWWGIRAIGILCAIPVAVHLTSEAAPEIKARADAAYQEKLWRELTPDRLAQMLRQRLLAPPARPPQTVAQPDFEGLQFTVPASLPPVSSEKLGAEDLGRVFTSGLSFQGREHTFMVTVECYRISPRYRFDLQKVSRAITDDTLKHWSGPAWGTGSSLDSPAFDQFALDAGQRRAVTALLASSSLREISHTTGEVAGVPSVRTLFATYGGVPMAMRTEVFLKGDIFVYALATGVSQDDLTTGPVAEFFDSIQFRK